MAQGKKIHVQAKIGETIVFDKITIGKKFKRAAVIEAMEFLGDRQGLIRVKEGAAKGWRVYEPELGGRAAVNLPRHPWGDE